MGLLTEGTPLTWEETKKHASYVRQHGVIQFINLYNRLKDRKQDKLLWGDEVEYQLVKFDHEHKRVRLYRNAQEILPELQKTEKEQGGENLSTLWRPEYASYMIEGTPGSPYGHLMGHFNTVEANMRLRRQEIQSLLGEDELVLTITAFPSLGCLDFAYPPCKPTPVNGISRSLFFPDECINHSHPRFATLTKNIRERRGKKVEINNPVFHDSNTPQPFVEDFRPLGDDGESQAAAKPDHVYLDAMGFGMGLCCLQVTFQACCMEEARILYDQLTPLCPIVMALSAATPIIRGYLMDIDCRWGIVAASVDDRTDEERGEKPLKENRFVINKSRYDSIDSYLSLCAQKYNDLPLVIDQEVYNTLMEAGIDHALAQHVAHLFIRDPISLFSEKIDIDDEKDTDHFENIQSTNWQTMRFKPPPPNTTIGWRVEFRPVEVQLTDFENAAFVSFIVLLTRVFLTFKLNLIIPISKVDDNMQTARKRNAVLNEKFFFRCGDCITTCSSPPEACEMSETMRKRSCRETESADIPPDETYTEMTIDEIINGGDLFPGLIPLIRNYLHMIEADIDTACTISQYLDFISGRASGRYMTTAQFTRDFVSSHPDYKHDSRVNDRIVYDLMMEYSKISNGYSRPPGFQPNHSTRTRDRLPTATIAGEEKLDQKRNQLKK